MARNRKRRRSTTSQIVADSLARLADISPSQITVLSEENDWASVGDDLRAAIVQVQAEHPLPDDDKKLVEA